MEAPSQLYFDDIHVDQTFTSDTYALTAEEIIEFATKYDPQTFHLDAEAAQDTFFRGLAASGWHTAAITMRLIVESIPLADGIVGTGGKLAWPRPTRPGDVLQATSEITAIKPSTSKPDRGFADVHVVTRNQDGETVANLDTTILLFKRDR